MSEPTPERSSNTESPFHGKGFISPTLREPLESEIAVLESGRFCWLGQSEALEADFEASSSELRSRRMWIEGICCVVLFNCFLISDYIFFPSTFLHFLVVRLGFATPPAIVALILLRRGVSKAVRESLVVVICAIFGLSFLYLYFNISPVVASYAMTDLAILVLFTNVGFRVRLPYAIFVSGMCLVFGLVYLRLDTMLKVPEKLESLAILMAAIFLSLVGNYSIERGDRLNFLLRRRSEAESGALADANDDLLILAREDRLTGLANRGRFEEVYEGIWNDSIESGESVTVIMIDIDHFKMLNDRYGHLYGDSVLRRVSLLLKECLRKEGDFVARYGGEEFVVVLPGSTSNVGLRVAQRIRLLIEVAGSPAVGKRVEYEHGWATVSCGMATASPCVGMDRNELIALADAALYEAKAQGRNRVRVAAEQATLSV